MPRDVLYCDLQVIGTNLSCSHAYACPLGVTHFRAVRSSTRSTTSSLRSLQTRCCCRRHALASRICSASSSSLRDTSSLLLPHCPPRANLISPLTCSQQVLRMSRTAAASVLRPKMMDWIHATMRGRHNASSAASAIELAHLPVIPPFDPRRSTTTPRASHDVCAPGRERAAEPSLDSGR
jgi:hypothetical protein